MGNLEKKKGREKMKREQKIKKNNWKKTAKTAAMMALGVGIGWGYFSFQGNAAEVSLAASSANTSSAVQNQKTYIGEAEAQELAAAHAGVTVVSASNIDWASIWSSEKNVMVKKCKLELEKGIMIYEIEFFSPNYEYEYEINAITGSIISYKKEKENNSFLMQTLENINNNSFKNAGNGNVGNTGDTGNVKSVETAVDTSSTASYIGIERAKTIAYTHAGVTKENTYPGWCEMDWEDGVPIYEVEFQSTDGYDFEYEIHAVTGDIISSKKEQSMHYAAIQANRNGQFTDTVEYINQREAEYAAASHAGITEYQLIGIQLDQEDGLIVYEVKFISGMYEYDYKIHAMTGEVIGYKKEIADFENQNYPAASSNEGDTKNSNTFISEADAKNIAVQHAGVSNTSLFAECELKSKNGVYIYKVEFKQSGFEYEYKINPITGEIISFEKEWDD